MVDGTGFSTSLLATSYRGAGTVTSSRSHSRALRVQARYLRAHPHIAGEEETSFNLRWQQGRSAGEPSLDSDGHPILRLEETGSFVELSLCRENLLGGLSPFQLVQPLLIMRTEEELCSGSPRASQSDIESDWKLLQQSRPGCSQYPIL